MNKFSIIIFFILFFRAGLSGETFAGFGGAEISNLIADMPYIGEHRAVGSGSAFESYLRFYGLDGKFVRDYGFFLSRGRKIFGLVLSPEQIRKKALIILLHGYLEHSGNLLETAGYFLKKGYSVGLFDLPGHGLSEGDRGSVNDFSEYAWALEDFLPILKNGSDAPVYFIGHSTACAAAMEWFLRYGGSFEQTVFVAPLVRPSFWEAIKAVYSPGSMFFKNIPRAFYDNSGDREYAEYIRFMEKKDPLQVKNVPLIWVKALIDWNGRLEKYPASSNGVLVIQGDADIALDWKANLKIIGWKFPKAEIRMLAGGKHILFHESVARREKVLEWISEYLD